MNKELHRVLALCLEDIRQGTSVEDCLARYPLLAGELEPLLRTASVVRQTTHVAMRPEFKAAARRRMLASLQAGSPQARRHRPLIRWHWRWAAGLAVFIVGLLGWGTVALANNSLPDETLYPVKIATEQVKVALTPGVLRKARLQADLIDERTKEIEQLAQLNRPEQIEKVDQRLDRQLQQLASIAASQDKDPQAQTLLQALLERQQARQQAALEKALAKASEAARPALQRSLERSEAKFKEARQIAQGKKTPPVRATPTQPGVRTTPTGTSPAPGPKQTPTRSPTPAPRASAFAKTDDGLASVECPTCSPAEIQQYLGQAHKQALAEGRPFNGVVIDAYINANGKLQKGNGKKLLRLALSSDGLVRLEWECGACESSMLNSLLQRAENASVSAIGFLAPSKKPAVYFAVSQDVRRFNVSLYSGKGQLDQLRPRLTASYSWDLAGQGELDYRTALGVVDALRYAREDFIAEWLSAPASRTMTDDQYASRLQDLKSGKAYSASADSFSKARLAADIAVALRAEGFGNDKIALLTRRIEGKNVTWLQFTQAARAVAGKDLPVLRAMDKGVAAWKSRGVAQKQR